MKTREITELGLILATAFVLSYLEACIPVLVAVPGVKLGLANIATMFVLYRYHTPKAFVFMVVRVLLTSVLFSGMNTFFFGFTGGCISIFFMAFAIRIQKFSTLGVSIMGAIGHNIGQIFVAWVIMDNAHIIYYLPVLILSGLVSGFFVGYISYLLLKKFQSV